MMTNEEHDLPNEISVEEETEKNGEENVEENIQSDDEEVVPIIPQITDLKGVGPVTAKKFEEVGIITLEGIATSSPVGIADITGMEKDAAQKISRLAREILQKTGVLEKSFIRGSVVLKNRLKVRCISTGVPEIDEMLKGGIETDSITEIYGEFGSGKTQFAHTLAVMAQKPEDEGGLDGAVLWIDTENTFRPERILDIAKAKGIDPDKAVDNIIWARAYNSGHQQLILEESPKIIKEYNIKLIIVDSAVGLFRAEYLGRGTLAARQQALNKFMQLLHRTAETYKCAALITNQVSAKPDQMFGDPTRPIGGHVVGHTSTYRLYIRKSGKKRILKTVDSPHHADNEIPFMLTGAGLESVEATAKKTKKTA